MIKLKCFQGQPVKPDNWREMALAQLQNKPIPKAIYINSFGKQKLIEADRKSAGGYGKNSRTNENAYAAAQIRHGIKSIQQAEAYEEWIARWASTMFSLLKPGGYLLAFGGTRTYHRLVCGIEYAGFEIRDQIDWIYGSGFPKSHKINVNGYEGWGTALKPAHEPICMARKPFKGSVANNVITYGTGAINIKEARIFRDVENDVPGWHNSGSDGTRGYKNSSTFRTRKMASEEIKQRVGNEGRWPSNLIIGEDVVSVLDSQAKGVSRFFYCPKPSKRERDAGLDSLEEKDIVTFQTANGTSGKASSISEGRNTTRRNYHPTVKPIAILEYLAKLVCPPGGFILDSLMGSGSTGVAALNCGFQFIGIEKELEYFEIAKARIQHACPIVVNKARIKRAK